MNFLGLEITTKSGKLDWQLFRRIGYVALIVWVFAVRVMHIDPFGLAALYVVAWLLDVLAIVAVWLFVWHVLWPNRPLVNPS